MQDSSKIYKTGKSSPLRTYSPKRASNENGFDRKMPTAVNPSKTQAYASEPHRQTMVSHSHNYATGASCGVAPTEKERMIAQLMKEAADLRQRERDYKILQDQLLNLEQNFGRLNEEKRRMDEDYKSRVDANIRFI